MISNSDLDKLLEEYRLRGYQQGIKDAAKVAASKLHESLAQDVLAEIWLASQIRALLEGK